MSATATLVAPMLPFDVAELATEEAKAADRALCKQYLGAWADSYGSAKAQETVTFADFAAAAERLAA